ncbi:MAG TPA: ATP-binding protein [Candidatus Acidoferrales bacterium]|nr:ATP-binding protein [Candidatus Acidoferrales bacterium]
MSEPQMDDQAARFVAALRLISVFGDLPAEDLEWLASRMDEVILRAGEIFARPGDPVEYLSVILEGEIQFERTDTPGSPLLVASAGQVTGLLPFSRLTQVRGMARAVLPSRLLRLHKQYFPEMLHRMPQLAQRLVALMSDRIREVTRMETQQEKLMALGKLSAGLAHELNNPAAAARRAAQTLMEAMENVRAASLKLLQHSFSEAQRVAMLQFEQEVMKQSASPAEQSSDPLEFSDREEAVTNWLERNAIPEPYEIASLLADAGVSPHKLDALAATTGKNAVGYVLRRVAALITVYGLVREIDNSTRRISDLVTAIKRYSYMDQGSLQEVSLQEDLDNTLKIFGHRLKNGITVIRDYDPQLPRVCAHGGELNQVWTNLIDNAIDAMNGKGELRVRALHELDCAVVEIRDNGPGIPPDVQGRVFDPFFTTKKVGQGTGLGLDTAMRIVRKHHGSIELKSQPGDTRFRVRLPFQQPTELSQGERAKEE